MPRPLRLLLFTGLGYVALVLSFETFVGFVQFDAQRPLEIITTAEDGTPRKRMLGRFEVDGVLHASAHHWPRRWYREAVEQGEIEAVVDGRRGRYRAVAIVDPEEHDRLVEVFPIPLPARFLMGFPPRSFLRLDPIGVGE